MAGVLRWMEMSPSGETGREDKEGGCPPCEGAAQMCGAQVWVRACGSGSEERQATVALWWQCVTDLLVRMKPSLSNSRTSLDHRLWFSWGTLTFLTSANTVGHKQSRRLLEVVRDNFLIQVLDGSKNVIADRSVVN